MTSLRRAVSVSMAQATYSALLFKDKDIAFNPLAAGSIYICTMNRLRIAARSALRIYVKGTSPTLLESAFDTLSLIASGLRIGHTGTKI